MNRLRVWTLAAAVLTFALTANKAHAWCNPDPLTCDTVLTTNLHSGNTHDDVNRYSCTGTTQWNGNSHVYRVYPTTNSPMWVSLEWTAGATEYYDLHIFILTHCHRDSCIADDPHLVYFPAVVPGADYWIIIEGRGNAADAQSYTLSVYCDDNPLGAELISFDASRHEGAVELNWTVASETDNEYFSIERRGDERTDWSSISRVEGRGTEAGSAHYSYADHSALTGSSYEYRLTAVDFDGTRHELGTARVNAIDEPLSPGDFRLVGNYPNPFNPGTKIVFELAEAATVRLDVFSVDGRMVSTLAAGAMNAGRHEVEFGASALGAGVYFARLSDVSHADMMKMILLK